MVFPAEWLVFVTTLTQAPTYNMMAVAGRGPAIGDSSLDMGLTSTAIATTPSGDLWIADSLESGRLLLITTRGTVARIVRPRVSRDLYFASLAVGPDGDLFAADSTGNRLVRIKPDTGDVEVLAGPTGPPMSVYVTVGKGLAIDSEGSVYFTDSYWRTVRKIARDGTMTEVRGLDAVAPDILAVDAAGTLYVGDTNRPIVKRVAPDTGAVTVVAGNGTFTYKGDGSLATSTGFSFLTSIAVDASGNLFLSDGSRIYRVDSRSGKVARFAGGAPGTHDSFFHSDGKPATSAFLGSAGSLVLSPTGHLVFLESGSRVRRVYLESGILDTLSGNVDASAPDDTPAQNARISGFGGTTGLAMGQQGDLYFMEGPTKRVRKIAAGSGLITTVMGRGADDHNPENSRNATDYLMSDLMAAALDSYDRLHLAARQSSLMALYAVDPDSGRVVDFAGTNADYRGGDGDNGPALNARFTTVTNLVFDQANNLLLNDSERVRRIDALSKTVTTIAGTGKPGEGDGGPATSAGFATINGLAVSLSGDIFISEGRNQPDYRIRRISAATGTVDTLAKVSANGLSTDAEGNLFAAAYDRVYRITAGTQQVETIAGMGANMFEAGAPAKDIRLTSAYGLYAGRAGRIYVSSGRLLYLLAPQFTLPYVQLTSTHEAIPESNTVRYQLTVSNMPNWGDTSGPLTVDITVPPGLTLSSVSGEGWTCESARCQREDSLAAGAAFPPLIAEAVIGDEASSEIVVRFKASGGNLLYDALGSDLLRR